MSDIFPLKLSKPKIFLKMLFSTRVLITNYAIINKSLMVQKLKNMLFIRYCQINNNTFYILNNLGMFQTSFYVSILNAT